MNSTITVPAWAEEIEATPTVGKVVITGHGRVEDVATIPAELRRSQDLLRRYVPVVEWNRKKGIPPPHVEFARAETPEQQLDFVRKYGPVWGEVLSPLEPLVVSQDLRVLAREQKVFGLAFELVGETKRSEPDIDRLEALCLDVLKIGGFAPGRGFEAMLDSVSKRAGVPSSFKRGSVHERQLTNLFFTYHAHGMIGMVLDRFPSTLVFFAGRPAELPQHRPEGILPMLVYMLRRDYLSETWPYSRCANKECQTLFARERSNQKFCSAICSRLQRGREYWHKAGKARRQDRRTR